MHHPYMQTPSPTDLNELLLCLYALSQERRIEDFQGAALELFKTTLQFDAAVWGSAFVKPGGVDIHTIHLHQKTPDMVKAYEDVKHLDSSSAGMLNQKKLTRAFHVPTFFQAHDKSLIRDFMSRYKQPNFMLSTDYDEQTSFLHWMTLYRSNGDAQCSSDDVNVLALVAPHLMQALAFNRTAHLKKLSEAELEHVVYGRAITNIRGVVLTSNPKFTLQVLGSTDAFQVGRHRLPIGILPQLLGGAKNIRWRGLTMQCQAEAGLFFIKVRHIQKFDLLTDREKQIAEFVAKGFTYKEIAAALCRAPSTVRNTIQSIYEKLQVNGIAELVKALQFSQ